MFGTQREARQRARANRRVADFLCFFKRLGPHCRVKAEGVTSKFAVPKEALPADETKIGSAMSESQRNILRAPDAKKFGYFGPLRNPEALNTSAL